MSNYIIVEDDFGNILAKEPIPTGTNIIPITIDNAPKPGDEHWNKVVLAMHMDTSFIDLKGHPFTIHGTAAISTSASKYGGSSAYFDGTSDCGLKFSEHVDFSLYGDFTIEYYLNTNSLFNDNVIHVSFHNANDTISTSNINYVFYTMLNRGTIIFGNCNYTLSNTAGWVHIAATREGNTDTLFINGVLVKSSTDPSNSLYFTGVSNQISIGCFKSDVASYKPSKAWIDDLRITNGVARYTNSFILPTTAFPDIKGSTWQGKAKIYTTGAYKNCSTGASTLYAIKDITITNNDTLDAILPNVYIPEPIDYGCSITKTTSYNAVVGDVICIDTINNPITIVIPATAIPGQMIEIKDTSFRLSSDKYLELSSPPPSKLNYWPFYSHTHITPGTYLKIIYISSYFGWNISKSTLELPVGIPPEETLLPNIIKEEPWLSIYSERTASFGSKLLADNLSRDIVIKLPNSNFDAVADIYIKSSNPAGIGTVTYDPQDKKIRGSMSNLESGPLFSHRLVWISEAYGWEIYDAI